MVVGAAVVVAVGAGAEVMVVGAAVVVVAAGTGAVAGVGDAGCVLAFAESESSLLPQAAKTRAIEAMDKGSAQINFFIKMNLAQPASFLHFSKASLGIKLEIWLTGRKQK